MAFAGGASIVLAERAAQVQRRVRCETKDEVRGNPKPEKKSWETETKVGLSEVGGGPLIPKYK